MRIVFSDIDGTLIDCRQGMYGPSQKTIDAVAMLKRQGDLFVIVSGRPKCLLDECVLALNPDGLIMSNGSYLEYHGQKIHEECLSPNDVLKIKKFGIEHHCPFYLETESHVYTPDLNDPLHREFFDDWTIGDALQTYDNQDLKFYMAMIALQHDDHLLQLCEDYFNEDLVATRQGDIYGYDINVKSASKGAGIKKFVEYLKVNDIETFALGDGQNDVSMMRAVDHPIGMNNGCDELKKEVEYITSDVGQEGFYNALKHYKIIL